MAASTPPKTVENIADLLRWRADIGLPGRGFRFLEGDSGEGVQLSYSDLHFRAQAIAVRLLEVVSPGDRALLLYPPSLDYIEAFFGCLYAGVVAVPAYPPNPSRLQRTLPRLQSIVSDAGAIVALSTTMISEMAGALGAQAPELDALTWLATDGIDSADGDEFEAVDISSESLAFLQYTSGSTGRPKGVVLDHKTLLRNEVLIQEAFVSREEHVGVNWLPLYHDMGLIGAVIQPVYCGCESVLMSPLDFLKRPARWLEAISRFGGTVSTGPNFGYDLAVKKTPESLLATLDLSTWTVACNGAEPIRRETMERFSEYFAVCGFEQKAFMPAYGLAEVGLIVSAALTTELAPAAEIDGREHVSCGRLLGDFEVQIVETDTGQPVKEGEVGEIWLREGSVAKGYWEKEEVNQEIFGAMLADGSGPYLKTGDLGAMIDGQVYVTGRVKDLIVIRGANHYPQDIEVTVQNVGEGVRTGCGAAFSVDSESGEESLVMVQEINDEVENVEGLLEEIREAIVEDHQLAPMDVVLIKARSIEKTSSGKIQRFAARNGYLSGDLEVVARLSDQRKTPAPVDEEGIAEKVNAERTEIEEWLVARVAEESGVDPDVIDLKKPFSSYGVDSAGAVGIVGEMEQWLEVEISATALYDFPTISALAAHLGAEDAEISAGPKVSEEQSSGGDSMEGALAIVGMACRVPGAANLEAFWELVVQGGSGISEVPEDRWEADTFTNAEIAGFDTMSSDRGGFLPELYVFDATFFGISASEARAMDPQQRMVLETSWHALEDAGWSAEMVAGSRTGVFVGQSGSDFARLYQGPPVRASTGMAPSITANRVSYWLDLRGPSVVVDTACSSALTALDQAMLNLRAKRCDAAIVGGVNAILAPDMSVSFSQARMLSQKGECRSYDVGADGYVRGEGCAMVVVKRLKDARRDGDDIRAVIRGGAINQDGQTNGMTAPSGESQRRVIEAALEDSGVDADSIGAVEGHGTGTELGDAIEVRALNQVFGSGQSKKWLGTVKPQIGHLEAASGAVGMIKAALIVERGIVPAQVNFEEPSPACEFDQGCMSVAREEVFWEGAGEGKATRRMGVSAFGFGGTNAHFVVEEPPVIKSGADNKVRVEPRVFEGVRLWPRLSDLRRIKAGEK